MKTIKLLPKEILNKDLILKYDLIILPTNNKSINKDQLIFYKLFNIPNIRLHKGDIRIISNKVDIMLIKYPLINITNMLQLIELNEYKNILLFSKEILSLEKYLILKDFVNKNNLDIDIFD